MKNVPNVIPMQKLFDKNKQINLTFLKQALHNQHLINNQFFDLLIQQFSDLIGYEPNLLKLQQPVKVIGDIHGQYGDLLKILSLCPSLQDNPKEKILFLGDYVDRGINGAQVCILLFALKIRFPKQIFMLRGNHQTRQMTQMNNFFSEFVGKYSQDLYFQIMDVFDLLPLACIINNQYFCVHGGISPETVVWDNIEKVNELDRFQQIPFQGQICDFVWSDPVRDEKGDCDDVCVENDSRGCSIYFGRQLSQHFLRKNKLRTIIRAHQIIDKQGYKKHLWPNWNNQPTVVTIFSAPNYCGTFQNKAVILSIENSKMSIRQFRQENPNCIVPQQYDAINVSVGKLLENVDKLLKRMVKQYTNKLVPDAKNYTQQQKIRLITEYMKVRKPKPKMEDSKVLKNDNKNNVLKGGKLILKKDNSDKEQSSSRLSDLSEGSKVQKKDDYYFRRSIQYFAQGEKRPSSRIFMKKPSEKSQQSEKAQKNIKKQLNGSKIFKSSIG